MPSFIRITATLVGLLFGLVPVVPAPALAGPLHDAAKSDDAVAVEQLIAAGADVNEKDAGFNAAPHWAADMGHLAVIRVLVAKGADINTADISDDSPLKKAVRGNHPETVRFLIAKGADVNLMASDGISALDAAARFRLTDIIGMLKNAGAKCGTNHAYSRDCKEAEGQN